MANRHQRRALEKQRKKELKKIKKASGNTLVSSPEVKQENSDQKIQTIIQDINKVYRYAKNVENKLNLMMETMQRLNLCGWDDIKHTEELYRIKEVTKQKKVKELLEKDHTLVEYIKAIQELEDIPNYEKLKINLVKDLNINPFEIAQYVKDENPEKNVEQQYILGVTFGLTKEHFGLKQ